MNNNVSSPILQAIYRGEPEAARRLAVDGGALDVFEAAALGDIAALRGLLELNPTLAREIGADGFAPLHLAAFFGMSECVVALIDAGADPALPSANAMLVTPLHSAVSRHNVDNVRALLEAGAPVDARQQGGLTALHAAAHNGDWAIVDMLLVHGADRSIADAGGKTAAQHAREGGHAAIVKVLETNNS